MPKFPCFNESRLEQISRILGKYVTGTQITNLFDSLKIKEVPLYSTKWKRIYYSLLEIQRAEQSGDKVAELITAIISPSRFIGQSDDYNNMRRELNAIILFDGLEIDNEGRIHETLPAKTISEAEMRAQTLNDKLSLRKIHEEVLKFCKPELLQDNYFHAVFEATKSLTQRIRELSGLQSDGIELIDKAFSLKEPRIFFNSLQTKTEESEHSGFAFLLKGCILAIRNPCAHQPKILWVWDSEDDAVDYLTLISLLHRKLDKATTK